MFQAGIPDPPSMADALVQQKEQQRRFLEQLLDGSKIEPYSVPVPIKAELRAYQQVRRLLLGFNACSTSNFRLFSMICRRLDVLVW